MADGRIAGVDEAGRGPLAGPVIAAAVVLGDQVPAGLADSKQLGAARRARLEGLIKANALAWCVAGASVTEIDSMNILQASLLAMRRAVAGLPANFARVLVDGDRLPPGLAEVVEPGVTAQAVIKGDQRVAAISAASILAKEARDRIMLELHARHPHYGFDRHKGYPTVAHLAVLREYGPCEVHRRSFAPVARCLGAGGPNHADPD